MAPRRYKVGDRVRVRIWRYEQSTSQAATIIHSYTTGVDGPVVVVLTDAPEWDGHAIFDTRAVNVELLA